VRHESYHVTRRAGDDSTRRPSSWHGSVQLRIVSKLAVQPAIGIGISTSANDLVRGLESKDRELSFLPMGRYTEPEHQREIVIDHDAIPHQTEINVDNRVVDVRKGEPTTCPKTHHPHGSLKCHGSEVSSQISLGFISHDEGEPSFTISHSLLHHAKLPIPPQVTCGATESARTIGSHPSIRLEEGRISLVGGGELREIQDFARAPAPHEASAAIAAASVRAQRETTGGVTMRASAQRPSLRGDGDGGRHFAMWASMH
jgi:hypothetical protein